jgi:hypothetical protein
MENLNTTLNLIKSKKIDIYKVFDEVEESFNEYMSKVGSIYKVHWNEDRYDGSAIFYIKLDFSNDPYAPSNDISLRKEYEQVIGPNKEFFNELLSFIYDAFDKYNIDYSHLTYKKTFSTVRLI